MVSRYMFIGLLVSWVAAVQGAQRESLGCIQLGDEKIVKTLGDTFKLFYVKSVETLDPQKKLFAASYSAAFKKLRDMEKMNQTCHIPTASKDLEKDFEAAFTVDSVNAGDQILVNAYRLNNTLVGFLFMRRVLGQNSKPVPGNFKLDFVAIEPELFGSGLGSELIKFILTNTEGLQRIISPARPTNSNFTDCLEHLFFEKNAEEARSMVDAIRSSDAPLYQKELAQKDMTAYVYDAEKVHREALKQNYELVVGTVLGAVSKCTIS